MSERVQVLTTTEYGDESTTQVFVFSAERTEQEIITWLVDNLFEARFEDEGVPKPTSLDFLLDLNMSYSLETEEVC